MGSPGRSRELALEHRTIREGPVIRSKSSPDLTEAKCAAGAGNDEQSSGDPANHAYRMTTHVEGTAGAIESVGAVRRCEAGVCRLAAGADVRSAPELEGVD